VKLFNKQNWLRGRVKKVLHQEHAELFMPWWKQISSRIFEFCLHKDRWWLVAAIVSLCFYLSMFIPIEKVPFLFITQETAKILVDQRASNIATIISITLVVVGFLINKNA
jgi:hypothetical protein